MRRGFVANGRMNANIGGGGFRFRDGMRIGMITSLVEEDRAMVLDDRLWLLIGDSVSDSCSHVVVVVASTFGIRWCEMWERLNG